MNHIPAGRKFARAHPPHRTGRFTVRPRAIAPAIWLLVSCSALAQLAAPLAEIALTDSAARLVWKKSPAGWHLHEISALSSPSSPALTLGTPSGRYTLLYSDTTRFTATAINAHGESAPSLPASLPSLAP